MTPTVMVWCVSEHSRVFRGGLHSSWLSHVCVAFSCFSRGYQQLDSMLGPRRMVRLYTPHVRGDLARFKPLGHSVSGYTHGSASVSRFDQGIADIIKLETSDGRDAVRFLVDVMQGNLDDFKPCHRLAAAKELLRRGFDSSPGHTNDEYEDHDESFDHDPGSPNYVDPNTNRYNNEDDPFDFENYDGEQFIRDRDGERALRHIYGSEEAVTLAHEAVARHRQQALFAENYVPDRDFTPIEKPEDDLYGKGHYGYNALRFAFSDNQSVGVANRTVEEFKKRMGEYDGPNDRPSCCYPRWSRDYALAAVRKSFEYPDRVEPQPDQTAENTDTGESQLVQSPEDPDPGNSESREPNRAKDPPPSVIPARSEEPPAPRPPPRKRPPKTYPGSLADGQPAGGPRERRDPGDIRIPLRNLLSVSAGPL